MSQSEDLEAIDRAIKGATLYTDAARRLRDEWTVFYDDLGWWARNYSSEDYDHARNLRNQFWLANAVTPAEQAAAVNVIQNGVTTEEMLGGTRRTLLSGMYDEPLISSATKAKLWIVGGALGAGYLGVKILNHSPAIAAGIAAVKKALRD